jgi:hypothetical protein
MGHSGYDGGLLVFPGLPKRVRSAIATWRLIDLRSTYRNPLEIAARTASIAT